MTTVLALTHTCDENGNWRQERRPLTKTATGWTDKSVAEQFAADLDRMNAEREASHADMMAATREAIEKIRKAREAFNG